MSEKYSGADWVKSALKIKDMSPLGEEVADVLVSVFSGESFSGEHLQL